MIRNKAELGDTLRIRWLIQENGVGVTGKATDTALMIRRDSDNKLYDFSDNTWQTVPVTSFTNMVEDTGLSGEYYYDLNTATMLVESVITCHMTCDSAPVAVESLQFDVRLPEQYRAQANVAHDYDTGITTLGAVLLGNAGVVTGADRAVFTLYKVSDGSKLLNGQQVVTPVNGIFTYSQATLGLEAHTAYFLEVSVEYADRSYRHVQLFTTM